MSDPIRLTVLPSYTLQATTAGGGTVALVPPGGSHLSGSVVGVVATPAAGWTFLEWLGDTSGTNATNSVLINRRRRVSAVFGTTLSTTASTGGSVQLNPPGGMYPYGTTVQIIAVPAAGNQFVFWGNAASGGTNPLPFVLTNANPTVSALFGALSAGQATLTVVPVGDGKVTINPQANTYGILPTNITLTANAAAGQSFPQLERRRRHEPESPDVQADPERDHLRQLQPQAEPDLPAVSAGPGGRPDARPERGLRHRV